MKRKDFIKSVPAIGAAFLTAPHLISTDNSAPMMEMEPKVVRSGEGKTINVIGDLQTIKLRGEDTNGQFTLIEEVNEPGIAIPLHIHEKEDEVFRVLEGEMKLTVGDKTTILKAGDLAFGPRGIPHSWKIVGNKPAKVILSVFPAGIEFMFEELSSMPPGPPDFAKVAEICGRHGVRFVQ